MAREIDRTWPYGRETRLCTACNGSGADKIKMDQYLYSRLQPTDARPDVDCDVCQGKGRIIIDPAPARRVS